jgi:hypothetical protein
MWGLTPQTDRKGRNHTSFGAMGPAKSSRGAATLAEAIYRGLALPSSP